MVVSPVFQDENEEQVFYDLSSLVTTLKVAKMKNLEKGKNLTHQMVKVLKELSIIERSNFYDLDDINSFYNMISNQN